MPNNTIQLSVNCPQCGATNRFTADSIPTFCSFCGSVLPNMVPHVDEAIKIALERERNDIRMSNELARHNMQMESADKDIKKERVKGSVQKVKSVSEIIKTIFEMIPVLIVSGLLLFLLIMMVKQFLL